MDPFAVITLGGIAGLVGGLYLLGRYTDGTGAEQIDWRPTRSPAVEAQNEIDDLDQMLEATNRRRRARGKPELTPESVQAEIDAHNREQLARREGTEEHEAEVTDELEQMLVAKNRRRANRGLPPLTAEEYRSQLMGGR